MDLIIIGGGPAGLSAAIRAKEAGVDDLLIIERNHELGGILNQCIHHGFGLHVFKEELTGPEYAHRLISRVLELKIPFALNAMVTDINAAPENPREKTVTYAAPAGLIRVQAKAVILAMGCRERARGALGIPGSRAAGVYTAGLAQAFVNMKGFMPGRNVVVLGSGDIGLIMARRMTLEGAKVLGVYELMPFSGGLKRNIAQCLNDYNIPLFLSHTVTRVVGDKRLEGVFTARVDENLRPLYETETFVPCDTLLLSVGLIPENELSKKINVALSPVTGGAVVNDRLETNVPGVFSCGNVLHVHDLADNVTMEAYRAAENAAGYIKNSNVSFVDVPVKPGRGVRYTVPAALSYPPGGPRAFEIFFRSDDVYKQSAVRVYANGTLLQSKKKRIITPGEMESIKINLSEPVEQVTVEITTAEAGA